MLQNHSNTLIITLTPSYNMFRLVWYIWLGLHISQLSIYRIVSVIKKGFFIDLFSFIYFLFVVTFCSQNFSLIFFLLVVFIKKVISFYSHMFWFLSHLIEWWWTFIHWGKIRRNYSICKNVLQLIRSCKIYSSNDLFLIFVFMYCFIANNIYL